MQMVQCTVDSRSGHLGQNSEVTTRVLSRKFCQRLRVVLCSVCIAKRDQHVRSYSDSKITPA